MSDNASRLNYLIESLGENGKDYLYHLRLWFRMLITKEELSREVTKYLTNSHLLSSHNYLMTSIGRKCAGLSSPDHPPDNFVKHFFFKPFEPIGSLQYDDGERDPVPKDERYFLMHERVLPDRKFILRRLYHNARENGLQGSTIASADLLVLATQHFLKNIITAVISRRKGYLTNYNKFVHSITEPIPNPWLKNVRRHQPEVPEGLRCETILNDIVLLSGERLSQEKLEHETAFKLAASQCTENLSPISLLDIFVTLSIYPSIIASDFLYSLTRERIIAKLDHETFDE